VKRLRKYVGIVVLYALSFGLLVFTNPERVSPILLVTPLLIFFFAVFLTLIAMVGGFLRQRNRKLSRGTVITIAVITALPVLLILLQSIGQLSARDVITLILIILVLGLYVSKVGFARSPKA